VAEYTISEVEAGKRTPRPSTLRKLAQGLDVEVADLYGESEYPLGEAPPDPQQSFNGLLEDERRTEADMYKHLENLAEVDAGWLSEVLHGAEMRRVCLELLDDGSVELRGYRE
jgi:transcriptional regulator with XRE-family HTH domain